MMQNRVNDFDVIAANPVASKHTTKQSMRLVLERTSGFIVVVLSILLSIGNMILLNTYTSNDYFWTYFNTTGAQTFVSDMYNRELWSTSPSSFELFSNMASTSKNYSKEYTEITVLDTKRRHVVHKFFIHLTNAVASLRNVSIAQTLYVHTAYCWVDFKQQWELAHTAKRQVRCRTQFIANGAVYMETMLRNTNWQAWYIAYGPRFELAYGSAIRETYTGDTWLQQTTTAITKYSIEEEVNYWKQNGINTYQMVWQNSRIGAFDDTLILQNAFGQYVLRLVHVDYRSRGSLWTTFLASFGLWNDVGYAVDVNASLVRNTSNSFTLLNASKSPEMWCGGYPDTPWSIQLHDKIGPIASIDLYLVAPPSSFVTLFRQLVASITQLVHVNESFSNKYNSALTSTMDMVPPQWNATDFIYHGGNPLCYQAKGWSYVQQSFGFDDPCTEPRPAMTLEPTVLNTMIAFWLQKTENNHVNFTGICRYNSIFNDDCLASLVSIYSVYLDWSPENPMKVDQFLPALQDIELLNLEFIQYATGNNIPTILHQTLIDSSDLNWSFYGWLHILDWIQGIREVVSFQGDESTVVLMSKQYAAQSFVIDPLETPTRVSYVFQWLIIYTYFVIYSVLFVALLFSIFSPTRIVCCNLWYLNRIIGLVWIGRPILFVRGIVAMAILSTGKVNLQVDHGLTRFISTSRYFVESFLVAGETLWFTYAINDIYSLAIQHRTFYCTLISSTMIWGIHFGIDYWFPFQPSAIHDRNCISISMDLQIICTSGILFLGSENRFILLCIIQLIIPLLIWFILIIFIKPNRINNPVIIPAITNYMISSDSTLDHSSSVFSGFIPFQYKNKEYVFSVHLWRIIPSFKKISNEIPCTFQYNKSINNILIKKRFKIRIFNSLLGILFLFSSIISSAFFIFISSNKLGNDFLWDGFNTTGMQSFLIDWFNQEIILNHTKIQLNLIHSNKLGFYNGTIASVFSSRFHANLIQFQEMNLIQIIYGLRHTEPCHFGWISTQYCFVDFNKMWSLANSLKREIRCQNKTENGAVYLESILKNTDMTKFMACYGTGIEIGIFQTLRESKEGLNWIQFIQNNTWNSVHDERDRWYGNSITKYTVQWQNYKLLGILETFSIKTALGYSYPMTLKYNNGSYQFNLQTSMRMYWGLSSDLWAVSNNTTKLGSKSLIRTSSNYGFQNFTMEEILVQNKTLSSPLGNGFYLVRQTLGPFGSIDMIYLPCPAQLIELYLSFNQIFISTLKNSIDSNLPISVPTSTIRPIPQRWLNTFSKTLGGSILCEAIAGSSSLPLGLLNWFSKAGCASNLWESFYISHRNSFMAIVAWGAIENCMNQTTNCMVLKNVCTKTMVSSSSCLKGFSSVLNWTTTFVSRDQLNTLYNQSQSLKPFLRSLNLEFTQYVKINDLNPLELVREPLFNPLEYYFEVFTWHMMWEWVQGLREVVSFQGDEGTIRLMCSYSSYITSLPNALEIPGNLVYYCRLCIVYTTSVLFLITFITIFYVLFSRGYFEGLNMIEINRVGGIVWVGRPLLVLRSIVAISLISTASAKLELRGMLTSISVPATSISQVISTLLSCSETCWLVIVLSDTCMVVTRDYTNRYSLQATVLIIFVTMIMSFLDPIQPIFQIDRKCTYEEIDFQIVCDAGFVEIGRVSRSILLILLTVISLILCFAIEKTRFPIFKLPHHKPTILLPAGALYLFNKKPWIMDGILYLDKASAFMSGLITISFHTHIYILDVKTWRTHTILIDKQYQTGISNSYDRQDIQYSVPMLV